MIIGNLSLTKYIYSFNWHKKINVNWLNPSIQSLFPYNIDRHAHPWNKKNQTIASVIDNDLENETDSIFLNVVNVLRLIRTGLNAFSIDCP